MSDPLTGKRVVILGLARQGTALTRWLCEVGAQVTVSDIRPADQLTAELEDLKGLPVEFVLGEHPPAILDGADLLCLSGGVPPTLPIVEEAVRRGIRLSNDAQIFLDRCPCHVIGITGSAGKTTTTTLVGAMCDEAGLIAWVGGNIGNPLISDLRHIKPDDIAVMELSSFQLEVMTSSPHIAAVLNITPNHLDRHGTMEAYTAAKARILDNQVVGDIAVLGRDDPIAYGLRDRVQHDLALFSGRVPVDVGAWLVGDRLVCRPAFDRPMATVCTIDEINLRGFHNVLNTLAACAIAGAAGVPPEAMRAAVLKFRGVPHRLEIVRVVDEVTYVNDSIATAPERVLAALEAFPDEPLVLLLGGRDKKLPWGDLMREALIRARAIITFGEAGLMIAEEAARARLVGGYSVPVEQVSTLAEAVRLASVFATPGDVVLLSPGCTSYDAYRDFAERGEDFRRIVMKL
ncbi:MAG: UDP-N-acetylmuramoyl-L-alanine--D-glutamate ligase [Anaerolineae bacterium]